MSETHAPALRAPTKKNRHARRLDAKATRLMRRRLLVQYKDQALREAYEAGRAAAYAELDVELPGQAAEEGAES